MIKKIVSIVIPAYNEEDVLDELRKRLQAVMKECKDYDFEVIIVENGSCDRSYEMLKDTHGKDKRFKVLQLSRNFGCDGAITAGLRYARGDAAVIMNADLQDPPEMIPKFLAKWEEGSEIVYGVIKKRDGVPLVRRLGYKVFYRLISTLTNNIIPENVSDFRLIDRKVYETVNSMEERNKFLRGVIVWTGFKQAGIEYERPPRFAGESKADMITVLKVAMNGIFSFSYFPLSLATILGFLVSGASFAVMLVELGLFLVYGRVVPGYTTIVVIMLFLFGMLFFVLGIMGVYISRVYDEVKQRPNFIVKNEIGFEKRGN